MKKLIDTHQHKSKWLSSVGYYFLLPLAGFFTVFPFLITNFNIPLTITMYPLFVGMLWSSLILASFAFFAAATVCRFGTRSHP